MDVASSGLHDRLGSLSKADLPLAKKDEASSQVKLVETVDSHGDQLVQRCVIIQRAEKGYGLTVSGDNPVFVQSVKEDGAAALAGVQQGDRIIKVNGTLVTQSNHVEVVKLIKSGSYVALTLLGRPTTHRNATQPNNMNCSVNSPSSPTDRITGPQPVDSEKLQQLSMDKIHTIRMMLEQELAYLEKLRSEFAKNPVEKIRIELAATQKRCRILEEELYNSTGVHYDCGMTQSPTLRSISGEGEANDRESKEIEEEDEGTPPLPPPRKLTLPHQMSLPNVTLPNDTRQQKQQQQQQQQLQQHSDTVISNKQTLSQSLENIERQNNSPTSKSFRISANKKGMGAPTHSRQRSSPDALLHQTESIRMQQMENFRNTTTEICRSQSEITTGIRKLNSFGANDRRKCSETPSRTSSFGTYDVDSPRVTPPGTPPPPYGSSDAMNEPQAESEHGQAASPRSSNCDDNRQICDSPQEPQTPATKSVSQQMPIISMEDEDFPSDNESGPVEDHGPFNSISKLLRHPTHLAVFIHFLISNNDPSNLFFYLVTDLYKEGNAKEMKKWAYEIHSTYLVPGAPLRVNNVEECILHEIDGVLQRDLDKEDVLRKVFWKARKKALEELNEQLGEFRNKRTLGLGGFFGPPDSQLEDKSKETKIIEALLLPSLGTLSEDIENANNKTCALASSLATLLFKIFGLKSQSALLLIDRCPTFVTKEKSRLKVFRNKKIQLVQGHHFTPQHYFNVTYCNHCQLIIWGVGNQGYQCQNCEMNIHKSCVRVVEESCIGALRQKKKRDRMSGIMDNIMGKTRKPGAMVTTTTNTKKTPEDGESALPADTSPSDASDRQLPSSRVEKLKNRYETLCEGEERGTRETTPPSAPTQPSQTNGDGGKQRANVIGRSESLRARREHQRHSFRKRSDPSIPHSKSDAEDATASILHPSASSSSCSSSTSRSLDSPSNSLELLRQSAPVDVSPSNSAQSSQAHCRRDDSNDSDFEAEADPPNWTESVDWDIVKHLKPKERKRQEVINELFHTERTHVRNLKVLERVFFRPMQEQALFADHMTLLFPNLEEMLRIHGQFNSIMKSRTKESKIVERVGDIMLQMFDGKSGENLKKEAGTFCAKQAIALEVLKNKQKKDQKLAQFLTDAEGNSLCRRLQLKDIIPTGMQRLTKYPLLIENLAKYTPPNTEEYSNLMRALECSKDILNHVNQMVKEAENHQRLTELQKKLEKSSFEKADHPIALEFRNLDLAKYKMIHEGPLKWKITRQKLIELHVLLLENVLVLLQKQDEKYVLKFHKEETKLTHSPIIQLVNLLTRNVATDKKAFFLVSTTSTIGPQIYELVAISSADRKNWIRHITDAVESYKNREGKNNAAQPESQDAERNEDADKSRESVESQDCVDNSEIGEASDQSDVGTEPVDVGIAPIREDEGSARAASPDVASRSRADGCAGGSSEESSGGSPVGAFQQVEILQIAEGSMLIEPSEVTVSHGAVLQTAEPVLTPLEKLRRKDAHIQKELLEKHELVARVLHLQTGEEKDECRGESDGNQDAKDLILTAVNQATQLTEMINRSLNLSEEDAVSAGVEDGNVNRRKQHENTYCMINTVHALNTSLSHLLSIVADRENERDRLRKELRASRDQIQELRESRIKQPLSSTPTPMNEDETECADDDNDANEPVTSTIDNATQEVNQVPPLVVLSSNEEEGATTSSTPDDTPHESHV